MVSGAGIQGGGCDDAVVRSSEVRVWLICHLWWAWVWGCGWVPKWIVVLRVRAIIMVSSSGVFRSLGEGERDMAKGWGGSIKVVS